MSFRLVGVQTHTQFPYKQKLLYGLRGKDTTNQKVHLLATRVTVTA